MRKHREKERTWSGEAERRSERRERGGERERVGEERKREGQEGGRDGGAARELRARLPAQAGSWAPEEGGRRGPVGLGERSLEAERRHGAAPDRGRLPAPAPCPLCPARARGGAPVRPAPPRPARAPPARCLPDPEPVRAGSAGCDSRGEPEAAGGEGTGDARAGKGTDADLPGGQLQRPEIQAPRGDARAHLSLPPPPRLCPCSD